MEVRQCSGTDLAHLRAQWPTAGTDIHGSHFSAQLRSAATYIVAWEGMTALGSAVIQWGGCIGAGAQRAYPDCIEINHLHVRPGFRGRGVGTALISAAEGLIASRGHRQIGLSVFVLNPGAARLYRRLGYEPTGVHHVSSYSWVDAEGVKHDAIEEDELLVKHLPHPAADIIARVDQPPQETKH